MLTELSEPDEAARLFSPQRRGGGAEGASYRRCVCGPFIVVAAMLLLSGRCRRAAAAPLPTLILFIRFSLRYRPAMGVDFHLDNRIVRLFLPQHC